MGFPFAAIGAGIGALSSGLRLFKGRRQEREAQRAIDDFQYQELKNPAESISISTKGSDIIREEAARTSANAINAARGGGIQSVLSALPTIQAVNNDISRQAAADIDDQVINKELMIAEQAAKNQLVQEQRDRDELAGLGQKLAVGQQNFFGGLSDLSNTAFSASSLLASDPTPKLDKVKTIQKGIVQPPFDSAVPTADLSGLSSLSIRPFSDLFAPKYSL